MNRQTSARFSRNSMPNLSALPLALSLICCLFLLLGPHDAAAAMEKDSTNLCFFYSGAEKLGCKIFLLKDLNGRVGPALDLECNIKETEDLIPCKDLLAVRYRFCSLILLLDRLSTMRGLFNDPFPTNGLGPQCKTGEFTLDIFLKNSQFLNSSENKLFASDCPFKGGMLSIQDSLLDNSNKDKSIKSKDLNRWLTQQQFAKLELKNMKGGEIDSLNFKSKDGDFMMRNSVFKRLHKESIVTKELRNFGMYGVSYDHMTDLSIQILDLPCSGSVNITMYDSLDIENIDNIEDDAATIVISQSPSCSRVGSTGAKSTLQLNINLTNNNFWPLAPKSIIFPIVQKYLTHDNVSLKLDFDDIECCHAKNYWFFKLFWEKKEAFTRAFSTKCTDIYGDVTAYQDEGLLKRICGERNLFPVYLIFIIAAILLAGVVAGVIFCRRKHAERAPVPLSAISAGISKSSVPDVHSSGAPPASSSPNKTATSRTSSKSGTMKRSSGSSSGTGNQQPGVSRKSMTVSSSKMSSKSGSRTSPKQGSKVTTMH